MSGSIEAPGLLCPLCQRPEDLSALQMSTARTCRIAVLLKAHERSSY